MDPSTKSENLQAYGRLLSDPAWHVRRREILQRDGHHCVNCGSRSGLEVHHKQYHLINSTGNYRLPWDYPSRYLVTLCRNCHQAGHRRYKVPVFNV